MTREQWQRVQAAFEAALERSPNERDAFLNEAYADAPWLRAEVKSLLEAHDRAERIIKTPGFETAAALFAEAEDVGESLEGRTLGPYIVRHEIGRGGMGVVYLADDIRLSRRVALKALAPGVSRDPARRERLRREARAAAALSHPGVATVYALEEIDGELYLACEYVPGRTIRDLLGAGALPLSEVCDIAAQVARALAAAHAHGIVHRDLKAENVIRTAGGTVKILDFGIARMESLSPAGLTDDGTMLGTPTSMAPEQVRGGTIDFRTDLFAFGVFVYEMASGSNPFAADTPAATIARILEMDPPALSDMSPSGLPELDRIVATCLRKSSQERYASTRELVADLERLQDGLASVRARVSGGRPAKVQNAKAAAGLFSPRWWWEFHQVAVSAVYVLTVYPSWHVQAWLPRTWGTLFLLAILACAVSGASLRLHLWFTLRFYPAELGAQRARARPWLGRCDAALAIVLALGALAIRTIHVEVAALLVAIAVGLAVASIMIEPATTKAAFPEAMEG